MRFIPGLVGVLMAAVVLPSWAFPVTVSFGTNADAFIKRGSPDANFGAGQRMLAKNNDPPDVANMYKSYFKFDIAALPALPILDAKVTLNVVPGFGNTSDDTNWNFDVFGLTNQAFDGWAENAITWNTAPANSTVTNGFLPGQSSLLDGFSLLGDGLDTPVIELTDTSIKDFLVADNGNDIVSFMFRRSTNTGESYVHSFASKEWAANPALAALLTVTYDQRESVPVPSSLALGLLGGMMLVGQARKMRRKRAGAGKLLAMG